MMSIPPVTTLRKGAIVFRLATPRRYAVTGQALSLLAFILFLFVSIEPSFAGGALPSWVSSPPPDSQQWIYGIGDGPTLQQAQQDALENIAGKLITKISSTSEARNIANNGLSNHSYKQTIETYVSNTKLSNFNVVDTVPNQDGYFMLMRMSRPDFVRITRMDLGDIDRGISVVVHKEKRADKLRRFVAYEKIIPKIVKANDLALLLQSADEHYDASKELIKLDNYRNIVQSSREDVRIIVKSAPSLHLLAKDIEKILSNANIITTSHPPADGVVDITGSIQHQDIFSTKVALLHITIKTISKSGDVLKEHSYSINGSSMVSYDAAVQDAVQQMKSTDGHSILFDIGLE